MQAAVLPDAATVGGDRLVVQTGNETLQVLRRSDGQPVGPPGFAGGPRPLHVAHDVVAQPFGPQLALTSLRSGQQRRIEGCGGEGLLVETVTPAQPAGWWVVCSDGALWLHDGNGPRRIAQTTLRPPLANATAVAVLDDVAWVASSKGHVERLDLPSARAHLPAPALVDLEQPTLRAAAESSLARPMASMIRELRRVGPWLVARGDHGQVQLLDPLTLQVASTLPGVGHGPLVGRGLDLITGGAEVRRWRLPGAGPLGRLLLPERRSATSLCRLDDGLVVGQGPGAVEKFTASGETLLWHAQWQRQVVKAVACDAATGRVWVAAMGEHAVVELDGRDGARKESWPLSQPIRRIVAHDRGWFAATIVGGLWRGGDGDPARLIGPAVADWIDLDPGEPTAAGEPCAVAGRDGEVVALRAASGAGGAATWRLEPLVKHAGARLCAIPSARGVIVAGDDGLWGHAQDGRRWAQTLSVRPSDLAVDADVLALALLDGTAQVRRIRDGHVLALLAGHRERVAALLVDRRAAASLLTASWDGTVRWWHPDGWRADAETLLDAARRRWGAAADAAVAGRPSP